MNRKQINRLVAIVAIVLVLLVVVVFVGPFYIIQEGDQAVITRFGEIVATETEAGLHIKLPFIDNVVPYSKRILSWDGKPEEMQTSEKQFIMVDSTARWKIVDPKAFYAQVTTVAQATARLNAVIESSIRIAVAESRFDAVVRSSNAINDTKNEIPIDTAGTTGSNAEALQSLQDELQTFLGNASKQNVLNETEGRKNLSERIVEKAKPALRSLGIDLVDLMIRKINYTTQSVKSVYDRMISERKKISAAFRSFGTGQKQNIIGRKENELKTIQSEAYKKVQTIMGDADAKAAQIYNQAYAQDPEFFAFWRSLESYKKTLKNFDKTLSTDADYFKYLYGIYGR